MKFILLLFALALPVKGQTNLQFTNSEKSGMSSFSPISTTNIVSDLPVGGRAEAVRNACIQGRRSICGKILDVLPDGLVVESGYTNLLREPLTSSWLVPGTVVASRPANLVESKESGAAAVGVVYLTNLPKSKKLKPKKYDYVIIEGYPAGQFSYDSMGVVHRTIRRFSAELSAAVTLNIEGEKIKLPAESK